MIFDVPHVTTITRDSLVSPVNSSVIYNVDYNRYEYYDGMSWKIFSENLDEIKQNYINSLRSDKSLTDIGWTVYSDLAQRNPVDGIGGVASITWSKNSSNPLSGDADLRMVKDASNRQGNGVSIPFTIANRHLGKILQISFDMELISGVYSTGDLRVSIIQDPTGTPMVLEPVNTDIQLGAINQKIRHIASFQTHINVTSYRLCIHVSSVSASMYTVDFANFKVWESIQSTGAIITNWQSYTPSTTKANTNNRNFYYRRSGGNIQISFGWQYTSGASSVSTALLSDIFPPGLNLDLTKIAPANSTSGGYSRYNIGTFFVNDYSVTNYTGSIVWDTNQDPDQIAFMGGVNSADDNLSGMIECPIQGWGSSVVMSSDTGDGRIVVVKYNNTTNGATTSNTQPIFWGTREYDTHNAVSVGTASSTYASGNAWKFTTPISGYYRVTITCALSSSPGGIAAWVNNSRISYLSYSDSATNGSGTFQLNAGDILDVRSDSPVTSDSGTTRFISIERISEGSQQIAATETVFASYYLSTNASYSTGNPIVFNTKIHDTHGAVTGTGTPMAVADGNDWRFTAPVKGIYNISGKIQSSGGGGFHLYKGTTKIVHLVTYQQPPGVVNFSFQLSLLAGEYISIRMGFSVTVTGSAIDSADHSNIQISRIGI